MWRGVVWCGVVWSGVVWPGVGCSVVLWPGVVWWVCFVVLWFGMVWCGVVWCGVARHASITLGSLYLRISSSIASKSVTASRRNLGY